VRGVALKSKRVEVDSGGSCDRMRSVLADIEERANLHFTLWMCIADDSSKVKSIKAVFIRISSKVNIQSDQ